MRAACVVCVVGVVVLVWACGGGARTGTTSVSRLPASIRADIHTFTTPPLPFGKTREVDVYGPAPEEALLKATDTAVYPGLDDAPQPTNFYLVVFHGRFVCKACTHGLGSATQPAALDFDILAAHGGGDVGGMLRVLPVAVSKLHRLASITLP